MPTKGKKGKKGEGKQIKGHFSIVFPYAPKDTKLDHLQPRHPQLTMMGATGTKAS